MSRLCVRFTPCELLDFLLVNPDNVVVHAGYWGNVTHILLECLTFGREVRICGSGLRHPTVFIEFLRKLKRLFPQLKVGYGGTHGTKQVVENWQSVDQLGFLDFVALPLGTRFAGMPHGASVWTLLPKMELCPSELDIDPRVECFVMPHGIVGVEALFQQFHFWAPLFSVERMLMPIATVAVQRNGEAVALRSIEEGQFSLFREWSTGSATLISSDGRHVVRFDDECIIREKVLLYRRVGALGIVMGPFSYDRSLFDYRSAWSHVRTAVQLGERKHRLFG